MIDKLRKHIFKLREGHVPDAEKVRQAYRNVFASPQGRVVLDDLIASYCGDCFDPTDSHKTANRLGERKVVESIVMMIEDSPQ